MLAGITNHNNIQELWEAIKDVNKTGSRDILGMEEGHERALWSGKECEAGMDKKNRVYTRIYKVTVNRG